MRTHLALNHLWSSFRVRARADGDRGDVPGWVMIVVMTAALVVALLAIAGPALSNAFTNAINSVTGANG